MSVVKHKYTFLLFISIAFFSCNRDKNAVEDLKKDKWVSAVRKDSSGRQYFVAQTYDAKLQLRVKDADGNVIFSEDCPTIDSSELPRYGDKVSIALTSPNKYINDNDASVAIGFSKGEYSNNLPYVQLLANISLDTKKFYTKKYKVEDEFGWTFVMHGGGVVQWYQSSIIVREGSDKDIYRGGGPMGLGQRGTQLVCYNRDFSIRYTKDIDANAAYYPYRVSSIIPLNDNEYMVFGTEYGLFARYTIVVSAEDEWAGAKEEVWQVDLKKTENLPADYSVQITDYNVTGMLVNTTYTIYDGSGKQVETKTRDWDINTGAPKTQFNNP